MDIVKQRKKKSPLHTSGATKRQLGKSNSEKTA